MRDTSTSMGNGKMYAILLNDEGDGFITILGDSVEEIAKQIPKYAQRKTWTVFDGSGGIGGWASSPDDWRAK